METKKGNLMRLLTGILFAATGGWLFLISIPDWFNEYYSAGYVFEDFLTSSALIVAGVFILLNKTDIPVLAGFGTLFLIATIDFFSAFIDFFKYIDGMNFFWLFITVLVLGLYTALTAWAVLHKIKPQLAILKFWFIPSALAAAYYFFYFIYRIVIFFRTFDYDGFRAFTSFSSWTTYALLIVAAAVLYSMLVAKDAKKAE